MKPWTLILLFLIIIDSIFTIYIGIEGSPFVLGIMNKFDISLNTFMLLRIIYCLPFLYILNRFNRSKFVTISYMSTYMIFTIIQEVIIRT